jgi:hypothetical protein
MAGVKALRKMQIGRETTAGTAVAATVVWRGEGMGEDTRETVFSKEDVGILGGTDRAYQPKLQADIEFAETEATFEQVMYPLDAGIKTVSATTDGTSGKIWTYPFATTAQPTIKTGTIEFGDDAGAEEAEYCFAKEINFKGEAGAALMMSSKWIGRQVVPSTFTGALALPTVEEILFSNGKLYIDPVSTYPATTQISNQLVSMDLAIKTGLQEYHTASGALFFSAHKCVGPEVTLKLKFEHDAAALAEKIAWRAGTARSVLLKWEGSTLAGTTYTKKTFIIKLVGKYESVAAMDEQDGNDQIEFTMRCRYNGTAAALGEIIVANAVATL